MTVIHYLLKSLPGAFGINISTPLPLPPLSLPSCCWWWWGCLLDGKFNHKSQEQANPRNSAPSSLQPSYAEPLVSSLTSHFHSSSHSTPSQLPSYTLHPHFFIYSSRPSSSLIFLLFSLHTSFSSSSPILFMLPFPLLFPSSHFSPLPQPSLSSFSLTFLPYPFLSPHSSSLTYSR